ncbi:MAG: type II toxin-antitoxin system HicA family toxin [Candidatus Paceibacterota bacterium]|jgi:predicted RNA binding protein YcfA (HicA-like mRNA interferase family)
MPRLKRLTAKQVVKILQNAGFIIHHIKGSHIHLRHPMKLYLRVVVPFHGKILAPKTIKSIAVQAELDMESLKYFFS